MPQRKPAINDELVRQVAARIRSLRLERGLSIRKLAKLGGCSADGVMNIEQGRSAITTRTLFGIARALEVQPLDLLNLDTEVDDIGYVIERMRQEPSCVSIVKEALARRREIAEREQNAEKSDE